MLQSLADFVESSFGGPSRLFVSERGHLSTCCWHLCLNTWHLLVKHTDSIKQTRLDLANATLSETAALPWPNTKLRATTKGCPSAQHRFARRIAEITEYEENPENTVGLAIFRSGTPPSCSSCSTVRFSKAGTSELQNLSFQGSKSWKLQTAPSTSHAEPVSLFSTHTFEMQGRMCNNVQATDCRVCFPSDVRTGLLEAAQATEGILT